jgi:GST-like protein
VEAALRLIGAPFELIEAPTFDPGQTDGGDAVLAANPMRQVPALVLPGGEVMTESGAILVRLGELHPEAGLAPGPDDSRRSAFLRWMTFVSSAIYAHYWLKDDPSRLVADASLHPEVDRRIMDRIVECWGIMEAQVSPGRYLLGDDMTVLDLYVAVVSRFRPRRQRFYAAAPRMGEVVRRIDEDPRLKDFWPERYPFFENWDRL